MFNGYVRVANSSTTIKVADCKFNAKEILKDIEVAHSDDVQLLCFSELCITGATCGDLFLQETLISVAKRELFELVEQTRNLDIVVVVGLPYKYQGKLYNVAVPFFKGEILGFIPKKHLSNMENRYFTPAALFNGTLTPNENPEFNKIVIFGTQILFRCNNFTFAVEIGEDLFAPIPPSTYHTLSGATIIVNPSAHANFLMEHQELMIKSQSARLACGYISSNAGNGESTTDTVYFGQGIISELGEILTKTNTNYVMDDDKQDTANLSINEIDLHAITHERKRLNIIDLFDPLADNYDISYFSTTKKPTNLYREISPTLFLTNSFKELNNQFSHAYHTLTKGLEKRLTHTKSNGMVLGVSGGLDSTYALLVITKWLEFDSYARENFSLHAITMPCFGTSERTKNNAHRLCKALGISLREIDITESVKMHLRDIGHPEDKYDAVFENAQARMRTMVLMDIANQTNSIVVGTGSLSELALGWTTYNGDHMSMYALNAGLPKTIIRKFVQCFINPSLFISPVLRSRTFAVNEEAENILRDILNTPISPELLPISQGIQSTEDLVGPYELHDFFLFHMLRWARPPKDIYYLSKIAFKEKYTSNVIKHWLRVFYQRFFTQQFKRNCFPDFPAVFPISLSSRGGWLMPSDASFEEWIKEIDSIIS